jgi:hypothetical protein
MTLVAESFWHATFPGHLTQFQVVNITPRKEMSEPKVSQWDTLSFGSQHFSSVSRSVLLRLVQRL